MTALQNIWPLARFTWVSVLATAFALNVYTYAAKDEPLWQAGIACPLLLVAIWLCTITPQEDRE